MGIERDTWFGMMEDETVSARDDWRLIHYRELDSGQRALGSVIWASANLIASAILELADAVGDK